MWKDVKDQIGIEKVNYHCIDNVSDNIKIKNIAKT